jgi:hypothetical protein
MPSAWSIGSPRGVSLLGDQSTRAQSFCEFEIQTSNECGVTRDLVSGNGTLTPATLSSQNWRPIMPSYSPELVQTMREALDEVMTKIPANQATTGIKAHMAELILKTAAGGQTSYEGLLATASDHIQTILSAPT